MRPCKSDTEPRFWQSGSLLNSGRPHDLGNTADSDNRAFVANLANILILTPSLNLVIGQTHESDYRAACASLYYRTIGLSIWIWLSGASIWIGPCFKDAELQPNRYSQDFTKHSGKSIQQGSSSVTVKQPPAMKQNIKPQMQIIPQFPCAGVFCLIAPWKTLQCVLLHKSNRNTWLQNSGRMHRALNPQRMLNIPCSIGCVRPICTTKHANIWTNFYEARNPPTSSSSSPLIVSS